LTLIKSLILWGASALNEPCHNFFFDTALKSLNKKELSNYEYLSLSELSIAACETNNPDLIWQIAHTETRFRFAIVAFNDSKNGKRTILEGKKAIEYINSNIVPAVNSNIKPPNVDIGPLQINAPSHYSKLSEIVFKYKKMNKLFVNNKFIKSTSLSGYDLISPYVQVAYLVDEMSSGLSELCDKKWVGCYHSPYNKYNASKYLENIKASGEKLKNIVIKRVISSDIK